VILEEIVAHKRQEVVGRKEALPLSEFEKRVEKMDPCRSLSKAIKRPQEITLIAEIKRASPSKGIIRQSFDPVEIAGIYTENGAAAISVLTNEKFFGGSLEYLSAVRKVTALPVLRKDFIIDPYQIYESRFYGADAILLIVAVLNDGELGNYQKTARTLGLSCLVEVHTEDELKRALNSGAEVIGINNRDLRTFKTDIEATFSIRKHISDPRITVVSESGIDSCLQMQALQEAGIDSVLVGEALMKTADPVAKIKELLGGKTTSLSN